jgi:hypothetical protein
MVIHAIFSCLLYIIDSRGNDLNQSNKTKQRGIFEMRNKIYIVENINSGKWQELTSNQLTDLQFKHITEDKVKKTYPNCEPPLDHAHASQEDLNQALIDAGFKWREKTW